MVTEVVVILDGASERPDDTRETSLERACTPTLDALARSGSLTRLRTVPLGLPPGTEVAVPTLLGWTPDAPVDRGAIEAAAHAIVVPYGARAWRVDVLAAGGARADEDAAVRAAVALRMGAPGHQVHRLGGHRLLVVGPEPLPAAVREPTGLDLHVWPEGLLVPATLDAGTVMIAAAGAAAGVARLMGAEVVIPDGATGTAASDLAAKAAAAIAAIGGGASRVVVHIGGTDEASHLHDQAAKIDVLERADELLIAPLVAALEKAGGGKLRVCPDHGCDPGTGLHLADPVPSVTWSPATAAEHPDEQPPRRLTENAVAKLPLTDLTVPAVQEPAA
ncbi:2,3-bisphosphoglycerate-independent phosphoglycerate mutase [Paraconexibacter sp. AEG42_29]|uniref:2,3-bisphosphoglycerate-independent phosphoglycerate mutase n=1 Tax=Paraconexibacter sp. AEG42_29 TaxID=2997339 RepID=A0AAU7AQ85_9ACTN